MFCKGYEVESWLKLGLVNILNSKFSRYCDMLSDEILKWMLGRHSEGNLIKICVLTCDVT